MSSLTGLSPNNPLVYVGPNVAINTVVTRNREPTGADYRQPETGKLYPFNTFWLVGKNPTTGTYGELWYLSKIVANVAYWLKLSATTLPMQAFSAGLGTNITNATGDSTVYKILFDSTNYNVNGGWDLGTSTFTSLVTGVYMFSLNVTLSNLTSAFTSAHLNINTVGHPASGGYINIGAVRDVNNSASLSLSIIQQNDAGTTTTFEVVVGGSTKTVTVVGSALTYASAAMLFQS